MELLDAIQANDTKAVERLIQAGADPQQRDQHRTPLLLAAAHGHLEILELLLQAGADPEMPDGDLAHPNLKRTAQYGGKELLVGEPLGHTALFCAARHGHVPIIQRLLQAGADPNRRDFLAETPLIWAAEAGHLEALKALIQGGAQPDTPALSAALEQAQPACALELLEAGAPPDQKTLVAAANLAEAALLKKMLALKPKLKAGKALAHIGYATRLLPAAQAPPGRWTTIFNEHGTFKRVPEPETKILEAIEVLLQAGAPVNETSSVGPALYVAASQGLTAVVQRLLEAGADPELAHRDSTPAQIARIMGHEATAQLLESKKAAP